MLTEETLIQYWAFQKAMNYGFYPTISDKWAAPALEALYCVEVGDYEFHPDNQPFGCDYSAAMIVESLYIECFLDDEEVF